MIKEVKLGGMNTKTKIIVGIVICLIFLYVAGNIVENCLLWISSKDFTKHKVVKIELNWPITWTNRKVKVIELIHSLPEIKNLTPIQKYICDKFGTWNCQIALAVARAESGFRAEAFNINNNNTIDVGIFQINSVHFKQPGCSLSEVIDPYKNVDCAYSIWQSSGWGAWSTVNNNSYLQFVK